MTEEITQPEYSDLYLKFADEATAIAVLGVVFDGHFDVITRSSLSPSQLTKKG